MGFHGNFRLSSKAKTVFYLELISIRYFRVQNFLNFCEIVVLSLKIVLHGNIDHSY